MKKYFAESFKNYRYLQKNTYFCISIIGMTSFYNKFKIKFLCKKK